MFVAEDFLERMVGDGVLGNYVRGRGLRVLACRPPFLLSFYLLVLFCIHYLIIIIIVIIL